TEVPGRAEGADVGDELVGHPRQGDLGDVELVLGDQSEQEVERTLEVRQPHLERRPTLLPRRRDLLPHDRPAPALRTDLTRIRGPGPAGHTGPAGPVGRSERTARSGPAGRRGRAEGWLAAHRADPADPGRAAGRGSGDPASWPDGAGGGAGRCTRAQ